MRLEESWGLLGMKSNWKEIRLGDVAEIKGGKRLPKGKQLSSIPNNHPYIKVKNMGQQKVLQLNSEYEYVDDETQKSISRYIVSAGDILISVVGTVGLVSIVGETLNNANQTENCDKITNLREIDADYLYYYLISPLGQEEIHKGTVGAVQAKLPLKNIQDFSIICPDLIEQKKIASVLSIIDEKIACNERINDNLLQQAQTLYREMFVNTQNELRKKCRAEEYFDIAIGKTPPRKEHQWFTTNPDDVTWVSISDMGNCGTYISRSSEQLTPEAVDKFNIKIIPDNTVLLSFKLTVGRIAITHGEMTTNEAIAHFKTDKPYINEYLYCYLKDFNYQTMGSTSSIATAVNSKIIKAMPFIIPTEDEIARFHEVTGPIFGQILNNQLENESLASLRDTLLPRLMSGELDVSEIDL